MHKGDDDDDDDGDDDDNNNNNNLLLVVTIKQGTHNYVPETSHVPTVYTVAAVLWLQSVLHVMLFPMLIVLYFYTVPSELLLLLLLLFATVCNWSRSRWSGGLRRGSAAFRLLGLRVRIPPGHIISSCECCVLSARGLCVGLITRTEESY